MDFCESKPSHTLVAFDNFFTGIPLMELLHERGIYCVATLRSNRKGLQDLITGKNLTREEKKETVLVSFCTNIIHQPEAAVINSYIVYMTSHL